MLRRRALMFYMAMVDMMETRIGPSMLPFLMPPGRGHRLWDDLLIEEPHSMDFLRGPSPRVSFRGRRLPELVDRVTLSKMVPISFQPHLRVASFTRLTFKLTQMLVMTLVNHVHTQRFQQRSGKTSWQPTTSFVFPSLKCESHPPS